MLNEKQIALLKLLNLELHDRYRRAEADLINVEDEANTLLTLAHDSVKAEILKDEVFTASVRAEAVQKAQADLAEGK